MKSLVHWTGIALSCVWLASGWSQESPRITPAVRVIEQILTATHDIEDKKPVAMKFFIDSSDK